jgi:hypothetical protein
LIPTPRRSNDANRRLPARVDVDVLHRHLLLALAAMAVEGVEEGGLEAANRRVSGNGWQRSFPYEGCGSLCSIGLFAEAGCTEGLT